MTPLLKPCYYHFTYDKKLAMKNKLLCTMSHSLIAEDINSWAAGKNIDLSSHPEIKCHVQQLLLHCYSSMVFPPPLRFFFLTLRIKMYPRSSEERWQIHTATSLEVLSSIRVLFDERRASGNTNMWWLPAFWKQKYF